MNEFHSYKEHRKPKIYQSKKVLNKQKMKRVITFLPLLFLLLSVTVSAQDKIVERSAKKAPAWIGTANPDSFTVSATDATLDGAQHKCMADIKQNIITTIAANITSEEKYKASQITENELMTVLEDYSSDVKTQGAILPFLTGISISNATDIYWEKHYVKNEKRYYYIYHIQYPFTKAERTKWTNEFLRLDGAQYDKYLQLKQQFNTFTNVEFIERAIGELETLGGYFFDRTRRNEVKTLQQNYSALYGNITISPISAALGEYRFCMLIDNRAVTTSKQAKIKSEYATNVIVKQNDDKTYVVTYNHEYCTDEDDNTIDISYLFGGRNLKHTIFFDVRENKVSVIPQGVISMRYLYENGDSCATALSVEMVLRSMYDNKFVVKDITLRVPQIQEDIQSGELNMPFNGKGTHAVGFTYKLSKKPVEEDSFITGGSINLYNPMTDKVINLPLKLPYKIYQ